MHLNRTEVNPDVSERYLKKSIKNMLLTCSQPLAPKMLKDFGCMMVEMDRGLTRVRKALYETHKQETLNLVQAVRAGYQGVPSPELTSSLQCVSSDKPVVRQAVKQLIINLGKNIPKGGLYMYVLGADAGSQDGHGSGYIHSLYEHVKALSNLVHGKALDKFAASSTEYFQMLEEGPTQILGKLIFVKKIPPNDLEEVARKLHVNMMQIIVNNCCGRIDIQPALPPFRGLNEEDIGSKRVINASDKWSGSVAHPGVLVIETLTRLIGLLKEYSELESANCVLTPSVMACVVQDVRYYQLIAAVAQMKYVDVSLLQDRKDKLCFFGNLANLMTLHVLLRQVEMHLSKEAMPRSRHSSVSSGLSRASSVFSHQSSVPGYTPSPTSLGPSTLLHSVDSFTSHPHLREGALPGSEVEWFFLQNRMAYNVGQLGIVSLFDLKYFILRSGLPPPGSYSGIIHDRCHVDHPGIGRRNNTIELDPMDPWAMYGPQPEPRMLFVLSSGHLSSPPLQVLSREMVLNQLRTAMKEYLDSTVTVDLEINRVTLPQLLVWYRCDFATDWNQSGLPHEALLHLLPAQMNQTLASNLKTLLEKHTSMNDGTIKDGEGVQVLVQPYSMEHIFVFDFEQFARLQYSAAQSMPSHRRSNSLPWNPSDFSSLGASATSVPQHTSEIASESLFHLTPASLSYLISRSELVAVVASLVGDVDLLNLQSRLDEKGGSDTVPKFQESSPKAGTVSGKVNSEIKSPTRTASSKTTGKASDRSVAEYRNEKLSTEFPHIWRHLLRQILPLESSQILDNQVSNSVDQLRQFCDKEHGMQVRKAILGSPHHQALHDAVLTVLRVLVLQRDWLSAVRLFQNLPEALLHEDSHPDLIDIHDFACACVAHMCGLSMDISDLDSNDLWRHLLLIKDVNTRSRAALGLVQCWPVSVAIELLMVCYHDHRPMDEVLRAAIGFKLEHLNVYQRVTECAKSLVEKSATTEILMDNLDSASGAGDQDDDEEDAADEEEEGECPIKMKHTELSTSLLERLTAWQNVVLDSKNHPESVLQVLLACQEFAHARAWIEIYKADSYLKQIIEEKYISFLLESSTPCQTSAFLVLKRELTADPEVCLSICDNLIHSLTQPSSIEFIATFILQHLHAYINRYRKEELYLLTVGCKMLMCLPESSLADYEQLVSAPLLMFEQLLMNSKIEWLKVVLPLLRKATNSPNASLSPDFNQAAWDSLIVKYARHALEFTVVVQAEQQDATSPGMTRSESRASICSQVSNVSYTSQASRVTASGGLLGVGVATSPSTLPRVPSQTSFGRTNLKSPTSSAPLSISSRQSVSPNPKSPYAPNTPITPTASYTPSKPFIMPPEPPNKDQWVPDAQATFCMVCELERFSMFVRRHHCRRCGRVVCAACSARTMMIGGNSVRTCDDCFNQCFRPKDIDGTGRIQRLKERLSGASSAGDSGRYGSTGFETDNIPSIDIKREQIHRLQIHEEDNERLREEFYYEQAPSTSLCLSMMELHSSPKECALVLIQLCDDVSKLLQPIAPGMRNPEVDYGLLISMLTYLLFNAKIKFLAAGENAGLAQCEVYIGRLELLKQLVAANCSYIPSMQQLTKMDCIRRLRDKLIEEERLPEAMDVSTKCGIDPAGVWVAWGKAALRAGDYTTAREKFSRSLKAPIDKNITQQPLRLVKEIVEQLESNPQIKGVHNVQIENRIGPGSLTYQECMFYLTTYANHTTVLQFLLKHNQLSKAVHYILEKRCSKDVFVEGLLVPCLASGHLHRLQDNMQAVDPTLEKWGTYITAMCRYMDKHKLINCLYQTQIFVKDFIRAAMTCITYFYQRGATSYSELFNRLQHLLNAKHNLERYLGERQWGGQGGRSGPQPRGSASSWRGSTHTSETASLRLIMTPGEVSKYINTVSLQIDVTKFLNRYHENYETASSQFSALCRSPQGASPRTPTSPIADPFSAKVPPTLFGSTKMKAEVSNLVLLSGNNVNDGFGLAFRIIQDFKLDTNFIYVKAVGFFSRLRRYDSVRQLLSCINDSGLSTDHTYDEVISACIRIIASDHTEGKDADSLIKMIRSDTNKINAYVMCGKLRSAYLIAVKGERVEEIRKISAAADRLGQTAVKKICEKWLAGREETDKLMASKK